MAVIHYAIRMCLAVLCCGLWPAGANAQPNRPKFEGCITYAIEYHAVDSGLSDMELYLPKQSTFTVKGGQAIYEQPLPGGGAHALITTASGASTLVMRFMGSEYRVDLTPEQLLSVKPNAKLDIHETGKIKKILGHPCNYALGFAGQDTTKIYYATDLSTDINLPPFEGLSGLPLEYEVLKNGMRIHYRAVDISFGDVSADNFIPDPSIRELEFEEFAKAFAIMKN